MAGRPILPFADGDFFSRGYAEQEKAAPSVPAVGPVVGTLPPNADVEGTEERQYTQPIEGDPIDAPVTPHPGGGNFSEFNDEFKEGTQNRAQTSEEIFRYAKQGRRGGGVFQGEGENYLPYGRDGEASFDRAYVSGPAKLRDAMEASGKAQQEKAEALSEFYNTEMGRRKDEMASIQAKRQQDQEELRVRQQNLESEVQRYSHDLHDQGKFWRNPGNIVAAVAMSLLPVFSNDPAIGIKMINQAVGQDMANRQNEAEQTLGALRSNLAGYHKLVGDRQAGDLMAQAEAHRMAALEVERIGAQFASPIAKAQMMALVQDQNIRAEVARQQAHKRDIYNTVRQVLPGADAKWRAPGKAGVPGAWHEYDLPTKGWTGSAVNGVLPGGSPTTASMSKPSKTLGAYSELQKSELAATPSKVATDALNAPDSPEQRKGLNEMFERIVSKRAAATSNQNSPNFVVEYNKNIDAQRASADKGVAEIAKVAQPFRAGMAVTTRMQRDMDLIERECLKAGVNPNDFLGDLRTLTGGPLANRINDLRSRYSTPGNQHDSERIKMLQASERFHATLAGQMVHYYHDMAGAAQNAKELENLAQVISAQSSWQKIRTFVHNQSQDYGAQLHGAILAAPDPVSATLYMAQYGNGKSASTRVPSTGIAPPKPRSPESVETPGGVGGTGTRHKDEDAPIPRQAPFVPSSNPEPRGGLR